MPFETRVRRRTCHAFAISLALLFAFITLSFSRAQQLSLQGLRAQSGLGQFNGIKADAAGNLYTLLDAGDGIRLLKFDPTGTQLLGQAQLGQHGDQGLALALDSAGNIYVAGTSLSTGFVTGTAGTAFPTRSGTSINSFLARFTPALTEQWLTFLGSGSMAVAAVDTTAAQVVVTGSIFTPTLPVTPNGIQQSPLPGSTGDGFVQGYSTTTGNLNYSTYLTGSNGNTQPSSIALDTTGNAYIAGTTSATGFPTINALVPVILSDSPTPTSGFLAKFTPAGDGILFSTYIPGNGISSTAYDTGTGSLLLSGDIARGFFPITVVSGPIAANAPYQTGLRIAPDGSNVPSATLLTPGTVSVITPATGGFAAATAEQSAPNLPLLPVAPLQGFGTASIVQADSTGTPQQTARVGGLVVRNNGFASIPVLTTGVVSANGAAIVAGSIAPTTSSALLSTQRFDFTLVNDSGTALPSTLRDAQPAATCNGSGCAGGAGLLARLSTSTAPQLAFSIDNLPNLILRNTGATDATSVQLTATGYTVASTCAATLPAGSECDIALTGTGPGTITASSGNAPTAVASLPTNTAVPSPIVVTPKELDFGVTSAVSAPHTRTLTITNLSAAPQTFVSRLTTIAQNYTVQESGSGCIPVGDGISKTLAANSTCTITLSLTASADPTTDTAITADWTIGQREIALTGYVQAEALTVSATHIGFGRQYNGGLRVPRYLYLSNGSDLSQLHTPVSLPSTSPFTLTDTCPSTLAPQSVCRIGITYNSLIYPSADSTTLTLDGGITVLIDGQTLPAQAVIGTGSPLPPVTGPGTNPGAGAAPSLSVTPTSVTFTNPVVVTTVSTETETVAVKNTGSIDFALSTAVSGDFTATACPATLTAGSTCTITVQFTPSDSGTRQGLLSVTAGNAAPVYVTLTGQGTPILAATNGTIAFGDVPISTPAIHWFKVGRPFQSLTVSTTSPIYGVVLVEDQGFGHGSPDRNSFRQTLTGACGNCYVGVQFLPTQPGSLPATLAFETTSGGNDQTTLTGNGIPTTGVLFTPTTANFGSVPVGSSTAASLFVLTNATGAALTTSAPAVSPGDFSLSAVATGGVACGSILANGESCVVAVQFAPTATGNRTGQVTVPTSGGAGNATLTGLGTGSAGIAFQPTAIVFANVPGTQATTQITRLTNTGSTAITTGAPTSSDPHFAATTNCSTLAANASCTLTVTYTSTPELANGLLTVPVTTNSGSAPQTTNYQVPLTGQYTLETAGLQIVPGETSTINFGALTTGAVSAVRVLRVNNVSTKSVTIAVQTPRQFPLLATTCGALAPGASCTLSVAFAPLTNGDTTGTLFIQGTPTDGTSTLDGLGYLEGYGLSTNTLVASGNFSPTGVLDFGSVNAGGSSTQTITLTNRGGGPAGATSITIRRIHADPPYFTTSNCGATLAINASCTLNITYAPTTIASAGTTGNAQISNAVLTVDSDAENAPLLIDVTGTATPTQADSGSAVGPISLLAASQGALTFATTAVGTISATQALTISNAGTSTVHVTGILTSPDFTTTGSCTTLNPGDICTLQIAFTPQTAGSRSGALELQTDAATSLDFVSLLGTGTPASVALTPTTIDFGSLLLGRSATRTATFTNTGSTPVTLSALTVSGDYAIAASTSASTPCAAGTVLANGAACIVDVVFTPTTLGSRAGTLSIASSATTLPLTASLTGIGTQPQLSATPNGLAFGAIPVGKSAALSLTLTNGSSTDVNQLAFTITGDFSATSTCGPSTLTAHSSCAITVTYAPTVTGPRTGTLTILSSDPSSPLLIPLTGAGIQGGGFTLTANGTSIASASVPTAIPASYTLALTPIGGFSGAVALTCMPQGTYAYISCSISPSTVTLGNGTVTSVATITTVTGATSASLHRPAYLSSPLSVLATCFLAPGILLLRKRRALRVPLLLLLCSVLLSAAQGCGSGVGDSRIRYGAPGNYQFTVTASSTTGTTTSQSVTLNLTITK